MPLYHRDVFMPEQILSMVPRGPHLMEYGYHAQVAAMTDRYGAIHLPERLDFSPLEVIEVEFDYNRVSKVVFRSTGQGKHVIFVVIPKPRQRAFVKTVWINLATDKHQTLRKHLYATSLL